MAKTTEKGEESDIHVEQEVVDFQHKTTTNSVSLASSENDTQSEAIKEVVDIFSGGIQVLSDEIHKLNNESSELTQMVDSTDQEVTTMKTSYEESSTNLRAWNTNLSVLQQTCSSLKQKAEENQSISYDGTLVWKITGVQEKISNHFNSSF